LNRKNRKNDFDKQYFKTVDGNEGSKCHYPTRLDTYGCGCQHDCNYCYAKSLLNFRGLWDAKNPCVAGAEKIRKIVSGLSPDIGVIRLGGMTDCFQPIEGSLGVTLVAINALNEKRIPYLIVTKSDLVSKEPYISTMDKELAHIQITVTCTDDDLYRRLAYEKAPVPSRRIAAIEKLQAEGFDVQLRLSPFIPEFIDFDVLNGVSCDKILVEFLRVNSWIKKWFDIDYSEYSVMSGGYNHLPLQRKLDYMNNITGFQQVSVCEDETEAY
jgi:DNA repair photolyase